MTNLMSEANEYLMIETCHSLQFIANLYTSILDKCLNHFKVVKDKFIPELFTITKN
jgi:hypothetical protein